MPIFLLVSFFLGFIFVLKSTELLEKGEDEKARIYYCIGGTLLMFGIIKMIALRMIQ
jgi:hypothetical protein